MEISIPMEPATGEHSETINYIYKQAWKMIKINAQSECKFAQIGDYYGKKGRNETRYF